MQDTEFLFHVHSLEFGAASASVERGTSPAFTNDILAMVSPEKEVVSLTKVCELYYFISAMEDISMLSPHATIFLSSVSFVLVVTNLSLSLSLPHVIVMMFLACSKLKLVGMWRTG